MVTHNSLKTNFLIFFPAFVLAFILGLTTLKGDFTFDDRPIIQENDRINSLSNIPNFFLDTYWGDNSSEGLFRPLTLTTFTIENYLWGKKEAKWFHVVNTIFYAFCAGLVSIAALRLGASSLLAVGCGLLFAAHPIHVEPVAGIVGRSELGASLFLLIAFCNELKRERNIWLRGAITSISFICAILFKESGIATLPMIILLFFSLEFRKEGRGKIFAVVRNNYPSLIFTAHSFALWYFLREHAVKKTMDISFLNNPLVIRDFSGRIAGAFEVSLLYFKTALFPWPMSADYSYAALVPTEMLLSVKPIAGLFVWSILFVLALYCLIKAPLVSMGIFLFIFSLIPVSNLLLPIGTIFADRLLFMPTIGLTWAIIYYVNLSFKKKEMAGFGFIILLVIAGCAGFIIRVPDWVNDLELMKAGHTVRPMSSKINEKLGWEYAELAEKEPNRKKELYEKAEVLLQKAIEIYPDNAIAHLNLGVLRQREGRFREAINEANIFYKLNGNNKLFYYLISSSHFALGEYQQTLAALNRGLVFYPNEADWYMRRAVVLKSLGKAKEAEQDIIKSQQLKSR